MRGHKYPRFSPRSFLRRFSWTQFVVSVLAVVVGFGMLNRGQWIGFGIVATTTLILALPTAEGLTLWVRVGDGLHYVGRRLSRRNGWLSDLMGVDWPAPIGDMTMHGVPTTSGAVGVIESRGRLLAALRIAAPGAPALIGEEIAERLADDYAELVQASTGSALDRIQTVLISRRGGDQPDIKAGDAPEMARRVLDQASDRIAEGVVHTEIIVVGRLDRATQKDARKHDTDPAHALVEAMDHLAAALDGGVTRVVGLLRPQDWASLWERIIDPAMTSASLQTPPATARRPTAWWTAWKEVWIENTPHRVFWVAEWPQIPVAAGWLAPLLGVDNITVSQLVAPEDARLAQQALQRRANRQESNLRTAKAENIVKKKELEDTKATLTNLAAGHVPTRAPMLISIAGETPEDLDRRAQTLQLRAARARLRIAPLHGRHDEAWTWTLPLCRGFE